MQENNEENIINRSNSIASKKNDSSKNLKLSYKKDLWMYYDTIKDKFFFDRTKAKTLLYIISQKTDLEYEYSQSLKYLYDQFTMQFDNHIYKNNNSDTYNEYTLNIAINNLINNLKHESELYSSHSNNILETIIKPLEGFIMNQCEVINEFNGLMESYEKEFKFISKILEEKQLNFHQAGKALESAMNNLEKAKKNNTDEESMNSNENIFNLDEEDIKKNEIIEKLTEEVEKNKESAKLLQAEYNNYINKANNKRENYIQLSEHIYDQVQKLDEDFIKIMKNQINSLIEKELNLIENIKNRKANMIEYSNQINIDNDITKFINSKLAKFKPLKPFEYIDYIPDIILKNKKGNLETIQNEISFNIIENLKTFFKYEKPKVNEIEEENIKFINETVNDIWDGKNYNKKKLELLFKEHLYRYRFLRMLNQYRIEGIFILQSYSFQNFCMTLSSLLENSIKEEDYECIKLCMILSQTFYLQGDKKIILQSSINSNPIWQSKDFWLKMIEFSINDEINNSKGYMIFLQESMESREKIAESTVISNLITYSFNMKLFGYPEEDANVVIDELIQKYKIDGSVVYASNISMKDIKSDIIVESIENIINNETKEEFEINNINMRRNSTICSLNEDVNNDINDNDNDNDNKIKSENNSTEKKDNV